MAAFPIHEQPVSGLTALESPPDDPAPSLVDQSKSDGLSRILGHTMAIYLGQVICRGRNPMEVCSLWFAVEIGLHHDAGFVTVSIQANGRPMSILNGSRCRKERVLLP